ncbi:microtubule-associated proteins 70-2 [Zostera marina]|uniref:Microtubule-associated proteins 70-2 n=1 Tax=Zostera marina TaxID=29655 RepID=A0A0K9NK54_ZOSMR|nr:microtubule-associated proteins 70-2 [Zostera marina]
MEGEESIEGNGDVYTSLSSSPASGNMKPPLVSSRRKGGIFWRKGMSMEEEDFGSLLHGSDPLMVELNRLENEVRDKDRDLMEAQSEIRALKLTERAKEKALDEVTEELDKISDKFQASEISLENKNLEIKRINEEKREALAAQFAAEATLRRVHASQKDEDTQPLEAVLSPLEAEIKLLKQEVANLQDDNKALERLTKTKEAALLEAEKEVHSAKIKASFVDDLLNRNQELVKQNDICQEEYKILDKMHRQKVAEVEKLGKTVHELEESLLSGASAANAVRDYQRQVSELKGEKKTLQRTLSRVKVTENRVAVVAANDWKDANDKVMPVKQWLEERRFLMAEMQQLRDKLFATEHAVKIEAQLKERFQSRLRVIEDSVKSSILRSNGNPKFTSIGIRCGMISSNTTSSKNPSPRQSTSALRNVKEVSRSFDGGNSSKKYLFRNETFQGTFNKKFLLDDVDDKVEIDDLSINVVKEVDDKPLSPAVDVNNDSVPGVLHDLLQKEVVALRRACIEKEQGLKDKSSSIEMLTRKVDTLNKAMEVEGKKSLREKTAMVKEMEAIRSEKDKELKARRLKGGAGSFRNREETSKK